MENKEIEIHIIDKTKYTTYRKLLKWYKEKDFSSKRNELEEVIELEILKQLKGDNELVDKILREPLLYLKILETADTTTKGYNNLISRMQKTIQDKIDSLN